jgi:hypothetical protein
VRLRPCPSLARRLAATLPSIVAIALLSTLALAASSRAAAAQILSMSGPTEPLAWVSAGVGYLQTGSDVRDGRTGSIWRFGNGAQYRLGVEKSISNQSSLGLTVTHARMPLTYYDVSVVPPVPVGTPFDAACRNGCDAHASVQSLVASFHAGGGIGIHQVIEIGAGATRYSSFRRDADDVALAPESNLDASLSVGYGFGFPIGRTLQLTLVQDAAAVIHERTGLRGGQSSISQFYTTRLGVRYGLGSRRAGVH